MHVVSEPASESKPTTAAEFGAWVRPHWAAMAGLARRMASPGEWEDVLQEALTSAWRKRDQFDAERGTPRSWMLAVTADQAVKSWRRRRTVTVELVDAAARTIEGAVSVDLERILAGLPARQRLAITLHYYLGLPLAEAAAVMGCSEGTVKSTLADARSRIRAGLGEDYR